MRILFVCLGDFRGPPGPRQMLILAHSLRALGHECALLVEGDPRSIESVPERPDGVLVDGFRFRLGALTAETWSRVEAFQPDLVHCYEPRTGPLRAALSISRRCSVPLFVRFADDDELLYREALGAGVRRLGRPLLMAAALLRPAIWPYKHPVWHRRMRRDAAAYDAIVPALAELMADRLCAPCRPILPAMPLSPGAAVPDRHLVKELGLPAGATVIAYTGSVFRPHFPDFELLLRAFDEIATRIPDAYLVHTGRIATRYSADDLARRCGAGRDRAHFLGYVDDGAAVEELLMEASVLAQPGAPSDFNRYRLPAKLQDYMLSGTPMVTFSVGFGELLRDGEDALLTRTAQPQELAEAILRILNDEDLGRALAQNAQRRARELFAPDAIAHELLAYYEEYLDAT